MGQSKPIRSTVVVVEDDESIREMISVLLDESDYDVIQCESGEAAELVLDRVGSRVALLLTDVQLAGHMNGAELARRAKQRFPDLGILVTSGAPLQESLPTGAAFLAKPWSPLDILRQARSLEVRRVVDEVSEAPKPGN